MRLGLRRLLPHHLDPPGFNGKEGELPGRLRGLPSTRRSSSLEGYQSSDGRSVKATRQPA